jgi:hypothetical protein
VIDVEQGAIDEVDVSGCKVAFAAEWPGNFFAGNGKARVYVDSRASDAQRRELEAVFTGKKGGLFGQALGPAITQWLPTQTTTIEIQRSSDKVTVRVDGTGDAQLAPMKDLNGNPTMVQGTAAQSVFQSPGMQLASAKGTRWFDSELRACDADSGTLHKVSWAG